MSEDPKTFLEDNDFTRRLRAIAGDLWGAAPKPAAPADVAAEPKPPKAKPKKVVLEQPKTDLTNLWKTADETIDWTEALAHGAPRDGLADERMWGFFHRIAEKVLSGDLKAYTEVLTAVNPLGELTEFADEIRIQARSPELLETRFVCKPELMAENAEGYLSAMGLRMARDLFACLPVSQVKIQAKEQGKPVMEITYDRDQLKHINFNFVDPLTFAKECGMKME